MALDSYHSDTRCTRHVPSSSSCVFKATISPYDGIIHITRKDSLYTQMQFVSCYHNKKCPHTLPQCHYSFNNMRDNKHRLVPHREKQIILLTSSALPRTRGWTQFIGFHTSCGGAPDRMLQFSNTPCNIEESFLQVLHIWKENRGSSREWDQTIYYIWDHTSHCCLQES